MKFVDRMPRRRWLWALAAVSLYGGVQSVCAEPYLAVRQGLKCNGCHVNPTGGGLRNDYGMVFSQQVLPASSAAADSLWMGKVADLIRIGGDLRSSGSVTSIPNQNSRQNFELDQVRVYAAASLAGDRVGLYLDQQVAPGAAQTQEAYVRYGDLTRGWYVKGGRFYLPFGWRLQDNSAFVRQITGINMATPDTGVEFGYESAQWSSQLAVTQGAGNVQLDSGHQIVGQFVWIRPNWRFGLAGAFTDSDLGDRRMGGLFVGARTGSLTWLGEVDLIRDESFPLDTRSLVSALGEVNWALRAGHNLKLTAEFFEPDRDVDEDEQNRWSVVYEFTPLPFVQIRAGHRRYDGIPQNDLQNRRMSFIELHGFF